MAIAETNSEPVVWSRETIHTSDGLRLFTGYHNHVHIPRSLHRKYPSYSLRHLAYVNSRVQHHEGYVNQLASISLISCIVAVYDEGVCTVRKALTKGVGRVLLCLAHCAVTETNEGLPFFTTAYLYTIVPTPLPVFSRNTKHDTRHTQQSYIMDGRAGKVRATNILDADAVARAMQSGCKAQPKKKKTGPPKHATQQNAGVSKPAPAKNSAAAGSNGPRFYQEVGLKIPLYEKGGRKRTTTHLTKSLRKKGTDYLLGIVAEYAGEAKRKEFKDTEFTKERIAIWSEEAERRALPAPPQSELPADLIPDTEHETVADKPIRPDKVVTEDIKGNKKSSVQGKGRSGVSKPHSMKHVVDTIAGKRKRDNAPDEPAEAEQQTSKNPKIQDTNEQRTQRSHAGHKHGDDQATRPARHVRFEEPPQEPAAPPPEAPKSDEISLASSKSARERQEQEKKASRLGKFMEDIKMHPEHPEKPPGTYSSVVVRLEEEREDRVLTASIFPNGKTAMHNTPIAHNHRKPRVMLGQPATSEPPFLKKGRHGRHGHFTDDLDRRTGRGHQVTPSDYQDLEDCITFRGQVKKVFPMFPKAWQDQEVSDDLKQDCNDNEAWSREFAKKYPGHAVAHLWPCGCEIMRGESEGEDSEEE